MAAAYTRKQVTGARKGTLTSRERQQRIAAARASAAKRKGSGTKNKNPQTPETKARERVRVRRETPGTPEYAAALRTLKAAVTSGKAIRVTPEDLDRIEQRLKRKRGVKVQRDGDKIVATLSDGRTLSIEGNQ
jgi:hypothetical protein